MSFRANENNSIWSKIPALVGELTQCIAQKWGSSKTAEKLSNIAGQPISRNAIIGYARRHGMSFPGGKQRNTMARLGSPKAAQQQPDYITRPKVQFEQPPEAPIPADFLGVSLMVLALDGCRYPIGNGPFLFCGQPQRVGSSYCAYHHKICNYMPERKPEGNQWFALHDLKRRTTPIRSTQPNKP